MSPARTTPTVPALGVPAPPPLPDDLEACCGGCGSRTSAAPPPKSWPPRRRNAGTPPRSYGRCSPRRSPAGTAPRWPPAEPARIPDRQDLRRLGRGDLLDPRPDPAALRTLEWIDRAGEPRRLRTVRHRQDIPARGAGPARRRSRAPRRLVHPRRPRRPGPPPPRRRHRHQGDHPRSCAPTWSSSTTSGCSRSAPTPPKGSTASSTPPTRAVPSRSRSNLHPPGFDELMPKTLATATVDRLLHHAHLCQTTGDSVRLTQALTGEGVNPLT